MQFYRSFIIRNIIIAVVTAPLFFWIISVAFGNFSAPGAWNAYMACVLSTAFVMFTGEVRAKVKAVPIKK